MMLQVRPGALTKVGDAKEKSLKKRGSSVAFFQTAAQDGAEAVIADSTVAAPATFVHNVEVVSDHKQRSHSEHLRGASLSLAQVWQMPRRRWHKLSHNARTALMGVLGFNSTVLMVLALLRFCFGSQKQSNLWKDARALPVSSKTELQLAAGTNTLVRIEGRIFARSESEVLKAPFSGRACVMYSASVSPQRHDGVHCPPLAFRQASVNFGVQLSDAPHVALVVSGEDVGLFDMKIGQQENDEVFCDAPRSWQAFLLEYLAASPALKFKSCVDLTSAGSALQFRESALLDGAVVTCLGEVVCEKSGALRLAPWRPRTKRWGLRRPFESCMSQVMISDDENLLSNSSAFPRLAGAAELPEEPGKSDSELPP